MIPTKIKEKVRHLIEAFNQRVEGISFVYYFQDDFLYLYRGNQSMITLYGRLTYTGSFESWVCAFFNYDLSSYEQLSSKFSENSLICMLRQGLQVE